MPVATIVTALQAYRQDLARKTEARLGEIAKMEEILGSPDFQHVIEPVPAAIELAKAAGEALREERDELAHTRNFVQQTLDRLEEDLKRLILRLG